MLSSSTMSAKLIKIFSNTDGRLDVSLGRPDGN